MFSWLTYVLFSNTIYLRLIVTRATISTNLLKLFFIKLQVQKIPDEFRSIIVEHVVHVHMSIARYSVEFLLRLRRNNYVTPKHYMDYLTNYLSLLNEKDAFIVAQVSIVNKY